MTLGPLLSIELEGLKLFRTGKVREVFDLGHQLLIVATDRISAYDVIMPNGIPGKGSVLTAMSVFWFHKLASIIPNHLVSADLMEIAAATGLDMKRLEVVRGRSMLVKKTQPYQIECVVRGFLAGSGWNEYKKTGLVAGIALPPGLRESERLPEPLFTPSTKEESGHDRNLTQDEAADLVGWESYRVLAEASLALYRQAAAYAEARGIIIADTKFEFGRLGTETVLIDEALTPDSSRFWPLAHYRAAASQPSFDKQFVRDYLESTGWDKTPPAPNLPEEVVRKTAEKYQQARQLLVGPLSP